MLDNSLLYSCAFETSLWLQIKLVLIDLSVSLVIKQMTCEADFGPCVYRSDSSRRSLGGLAIGIVSESWLSKQFLFSDCAWWFHTTLFTLILMSKPPPYLWISRQLEFLLLPGSGRLVLYSCYKFQFTWFWASLHAIPSSVGENSSFIFI